MLTLLATSSKRVLTSLRDIMSQRGVSISLVALMVAGLALVLVAWRLSTDVAPIIFGAGDGLFELRGSVGQLLTEGSPMLDEMNVFQKTIGQKDGARYSKANQAEAK